MSENEDNRIRLFAAIEGGSEFWSHEIAEQGPTEVVERLLAGNYEAAKSSAEKIATRIRSFSANEILERIESSGSFLITPSDLDWPHSLNDLSAPPIALIGKGQREILPRLEESIAIVGTRNPTPYGLRVAGELAAGVVDRDWAVVSGGAIGIDSAAHKGAIIAEGVTVAVLASGTSVKYPASNERLFAEIESQGLFLSEVMPTVPAVPSRFLTRNRLIAALSRGTVVVEAAFRSGSLRTARDAAAIYRPVMAIPGLITSPTSEGCHRLVAERCAELVSSVSEIFAQVTLL
jgi:DNA protecting protein DprA